MSPDKERARLASLYASLSDEELEQIASSGDELSEAAYGELNAEIARRGLAIAIVPPRAPDMNVLEVEKTVTLRKFLDLPEAFLAKGCLESAGIQAFLIDDNMVRLDWFISNILGGVKLQVLAKDAEAAEEILSKPIPETDEDGYSELLEDDPHGAK